jgi:hypothetical protein
MTQIFQDIDIFGSENYSGSAKEYFDRDAVKNSITLWLMMKKGEYIYNPSEGGTLDTSLFKNMTGDFEEIIRFEIESDFQIYFEEIVELIDIQIKSNRTQRYTEVHVIYKDLINGGVSEINIYPKEFSKKIEASYEEWELTGESLFNFVQIKKVEMLGQKLVYNSNESTWIWGNRIKFIGFDFSDPYFEEILEFINLV